jgi:hypothetical protein
MRKGWTFPGHVLDNGKASSSHCDLCEDVIACSIYATVVTMSGIKAVQIINNILLHTYTVSMNQLIRVTS